MRQMIGLVAAGVVLAGLSVPASSHDNHGGFSPPPQAVPETRVAPGGICGWYVVLGCSRRENGAWQTLNSLGGPGVGGWAGAHVVHTNDYPNFRNGWWCVADGPYQSRADAESIAWREAVRDAYVKSGC